VKCVKALSDELGDILWYLSIISHELKVPLNTIALNNIYKLEQRKLKNTLGGSGDGR
jgi:NTP pyrophosphatase (non-canonical NTP hydrolase)